MLTSKYDLFVLRNQISWVTACKKILLMIFSYMCAVVLESLASRMCRVYLP